VKLFVIIFLAINLLMVSTKSYAYTYEYGETEAGFWKGVLQGCLTPITVPVRVLTSKWGVYSSYNTGWGYNIGFFCSSNPANRVYYCISDNSYNTQDYLVDNPCSDFVAGVVKRYASITRRIEKSTRHPL